jgi:magnesium chelatase family protein
VLFLDELPEFNSHVLEMLRQPMENKTVTISRAHGSLTFPASFMMVAAMNPCPCGYYGDVIYDKLANATRGEPSDTIRARVGAARERQQQHLAGTSLLCNTDMGPAQIREFCAPLPAACFLQPARGRPGAMRQMHLSARAYHRILKVSRTIADLEGTEEIQTHHLAEALQYRSRVLDM